MTMPSRTPRLKALLSRWLPASPTSQAARFSAENERGFRVGHSPGQAERDRFVYDREEVQRLALEAWRANPLARRLVELTSQYVVGGGVAVSCRHEPTARFLTAFWEHPLNRMAVRCFEWCDELTRTGNLFVLVSTDLGGMSYVRAVPAAQVERIESRANDIEQPLAFYPRPTLADPQPRPWPAYHPHQDTPDENGFYPPVMLHYAINRPVGAQWGESDLAPVLRWLSRYANWLEDRARLNRFRTAFLYVVKGRFASEAERLARQAALNAHPPAPGSVLVCDEGESWDVLSARLESHDANADGLALKKMIAAGAGLPLHFLAEPESATRTTAEAAGGPTFRHFEQRQVLFCWLLRDLLGVVANRRAAIDRKVARRAAIEVNAADISARDNAALAYAAASISTLVLALRDRRLIDDAELLRLVYRFAGEALDPQEMLQRAAAAPPPVGCPPPGPESGAARPRPGPASGGELSPSAYEPRTP